MVIILVEKFRLRGLPAGEGGDELALHVDHAVLLRYSNPPVIRR